MSEVAVRAIADALVDADPNDLPGDEAMHRAWKVFHFLSDRGFAIEMNCNPSTGKAEPPPTYEPG